MSFNEGIANTVQQLALQRLCPVTMYDKRTRTYANHRNSGVPFFARLSYDTRVLIYSYLDFFPFPNYRDSSGFPASCFAAREEIAKETPRQLWTYFQRLKKKAAKANSAFRLAPSIDAQTAMLGLRTLIVLVEHINETPFDEGLLALHLDRLEVRLLRDPFDNTHRRSRDRMLNGMLHAVLSPIQNAVGSRCDMNITELAVVWCSSDQPHVLSRRRWINGNTTHFDRDMKEALMKDLSVSIDYPWPKITFAMTKNGCTGKLVLRSDLRWRPRADWLLYLPRQPGLRGDRPTVKVLYEPLQEHKDTTSPPKKPPKSNKRLRDPEARVNARKSRPGGCSTTAITSA